MFDYEIFGGNLPAVAVRLLEGESVYAEAGAMAWMSDGVSMDTRMKGGFGKGFGRALTGAKMFLVTFTGMRAGGEITFASTMPGDILKFDIGEIEYVCQKRAFLCAQPDVELSMEVVKGAMPKLFGGEGFFLQRLSGSGAAFVKIDGTCKKIRLAEGEKIKVSSGYVAAFEAGMDYRVEAVKGFSNVFFSGEGLFVSTLTGPGNVWLQTMPLSVLANAVAPYVPRDTAVDYNSRR